MPPGGDRCIKLNLQAKLHSGCFASAVGVCVCSVAVLSTSSGVMATQIGNCVAVHSKKITLSEAISLQPLQLTDNRKLQQVEEELKKLVLSEETVYRIRDIFEDEMDKGLARKPSAPSSLLMENTYIPELPNGTEEGQFLALDLGGTNSRVLLLELEAGQVIKEEVKHYHVPEHVRLGHGVHLFDFLAQCIHDFVHDKGLDGVRIPLGFTFSFPLTQRALNVGILVAWTKTFNCSYTVGNDTVKMLKDAISRRGDLDVDVVAILNDTTGTLVQGACLDPNTAIGLILGTGSNACYFEKAENIHSWEGERHGEKEVIIDVEWGAFGDNGILDFVKTDFDREVDNKSLLVNSFTFEKYISGKYMGEIVRVILVKLAQDGLLFDGEVSDALLTHGSFSTKNVSIVEQDTMDNKHDNIALILDDLSLSFDAEDIEIVKYVCSVVTNRAALLVSICTACLLNRMNRPETTIAVDGSLYKFHPRLKTLMKKYITLLAPGKKFQLLQAEDGSGKGACLVAAIARRLHKRQSTT